MPSQISPQAFVHESAIIGDGVIIEPFAYTIPGVTIGDRTWVGPNANILESIQSEQIVKSTQVPLSVQTLRI